MKIDGNSKQTLLVGIAILTLIAGLFDFQAGAVIGLVGVGLQIFVRSNSHRSSVPLKGLIWNVICVISLIVGVALSYTMWNVQSVGTTDTILRAVSLGVLSISNLLYAITGV